MQDDKTAGVRVWDAFVRIFHWSLVVLVSLAAVSGFLLRPTSINLHVLAGTAILALVLARLIWGLYGGPFARFSSFVASLPTVLVHLRDLASGRADRHLGHNPLGAVMILALLLGLLGLCLSGAMLLGGVFRAGPFASLVSYAFGRSLSGLHETLAFALIALIAAHLAGAIFESWRTDENLPLAMVTGRKRQLDAPPHAGAGPVARPARAILAGGLGALLIGGLAWGLAYRPLTAAPVVIAGTSYAKQCADCHAVFHPSLLPASGWVLLMQQLGDHFGEDASLPAADQAEITAFLTGHAAEATDSKPAHMLVRTDPAKPFQITASPFWVRTHARLDAALFAAAPISSKSNCSACHRDAASGWFYPGNIEIPDLTKGATP